ncbi:hypothetical protein AA12717_0374 [Gluconacetobacter sacchari DSM 12717]|uniref:DUF6874 domain-containing protein n=2 Tax=Gluconacetobacter sacchari TaxID=92759 RepID=A0A7W4NLQ1_9PROT|nr:hypothetical protein [Gluconacetobacter sacchari]MBB2160109.1 hypothetical protein [Gluconacetobacter sacchari]GBQ19857.1 hypothetical protein AA12717_0374 [Gluconacetobacter sacchari DSM 12717]
MVKFDISVEDAVLVGLIADRVVDVLISGGAERIEIPWKEFCLEMRMDLVAVHANGCPMDFDRLLNADKNTLMHDVGGIAKYLDRDTGRLTECFRPRTALKEAQS